ncbi:unnamed protein product [Amoebophrya sp. A120]|nr:unnamed protein product [Amoebophrya sp. A120]|eukprot:GSA120T00019950001.1
MSWFIVVPRPPGRSFYLHDRQHPSCSRRRGAVFRGHQPRLRRAHSAGARRCFTCLDQLEVTRKVLVAPGWWSCRIRLLMSRRLVHLEALPFLIFMVPLILIFEQILTFIPMKDDHDRRPPLEETPPRPTSAVIFVSASIAGLTRPICPATGYGHCGNATTVRMSTQVNIWQGSLKKCDADCRGLTDCAAFSYGMANNVRHRCWFYETSVGCTGASSTADAYSYTTFTLARNTEACVDSSTLEEPPSCPVAFDGGCDKPPEQWIAAMHYDRTDYTIKEGRYLCANTPDCDSFWLVGSSATSGRLVLRKAGCTLKASEAGSERGFLLSECPPTTSTTTTTTTTTARVDTLQTPLCPAEWAGASFGTSLGWCTNQESNKKLHVNTNAGNTILTCDLECRLTPTCTHYVMDNSATPVSCTFYSEGCAFGDRPHETVNDVVKKLIAFSVARNAASCIDMHEVPRLDDPDTKCVSVVKGCATAASGANARNTMTLYSYQDREYGLEECRYLCAMTEKCVQFHLNSNYLSGTSTRPGCTLLKGKSCTEPDPVQSYDNWKGYNLDACPIRGSVCPAVGQGNYEDGSWWTTTSITRVDQATSTWDTFVTDYDHFCRGRGYHRVCGTIMKDAGGGGIGSFAQTGGLWKPASMSYMKFDLALNDHKCRKYVPRVDQTSCPVAFTSPCGGNSDGSRNLYTATHTATYNGQKYSVADCRYLCAETPQCSSFIVQASTEVCTLYKQGCTADSTDADYEGYHLASCHLKDDGIIGSFVPPSALLETYHTLDSSSNGSPLWRPEYDFGSYSKDTEFFSVKGGYCATFKQWHQVEFRDGEAHFVTGMMLFRKREPPNDSARVVNQVEHSLDGTGWTAVTSPGALSPTGTWVTLNQNARKLRVSSSTSSGMVTYCGIWVYETTTTTTTPVSYMPAATAAPVDVQLLVDPICVAEFAGTCVGGPFIKVNGNNYFNLAGQVGGLQGCDKKCRDFAASGVAGQECESFRWDAGIHGGSRKQRCHYFRAGCVAAGTQSNSDLHDFTIFTLQKNRGSCMSAHEVPAISTDAGDCDAAYNGACTAPGDVDDGTLLATYHYRNFKLSECRWLCAMTEGCASFFLRQGTGICKVYKTGCTEDTSQAANWQGYDLATCKLQGKVCPAAWAGWCAEKDALQLPAVTTVDQSTSLKDTRIADLDVYCRGRGYNGTASSSCASFSRNQFTGHVSYFRAGCTPDPKAFNQMQWSLTQNDIKCRHPGHVPALGTCNHAWMGWCSNWQDKKIGAGMYYNDRPYTVAECRYLCAETPECAGFAHKFEHGINDCSLFRAGCEKTVELPRAHRFYHLSECAISGPALDITGQFVHYSHLRAAASSGHDPKTAIFPYRRAEHDYTEHDFMGTEDTRMSKEGPSACLSILKGTAPAGSWEVEFRDNQFRNLTGVVFFAHATALRCPGGGKPDTLEYEGVSDADGVTPTTFSLDLTGFSLATTGTWIPLGRAVRKLKILKTNNHLCFCGLSLYRLPPPPEGEDSGGSSSSDSGSTTSTETTTPGEDDFTRITNTFPRLAPGAVPVEKPLKSPSCYGGVRLEYAGVWDTVDSSSEGTDESGVALLKTYPVSRQAPATTGTGTAFFLTPNPARAGSCWESAAGDSSIYWKVEWKVGAGNTHINAPAMIRLYNYAAAYTSLPGNSGKENRLKKARVRVSRTFNMYGWSFGGTNPVLGSLDPDADPPAACFPPSPTSHLYPDWAADNCRVVEDLSPLYDPATRYIDIPFMQHWRVGLPNGAPGVQDNGEGPDTKGIEISWNAARHGAPGGSDIINVCGLVVLEDYSTRVLDGPSEKYLASALPIDLYNASEYSHVLFDWKTEYGPTQELYLDGPPFYDDWRPLVVNGTAAELAVPHVSDGEILPGWWFSWYAAHNGPVVLAALLIEIDWKDQGWGNRKGGLQLERGGVVYNVEFAPKSRQKELHVVTGCDSDFSFLTAEELSEGAARTKIKINQRLGHGSGHVLHLLDLKIHGLLLPQRKRPAARRALQEDRAPRTGGHANKPEQGSSNTRRATSMSSNDREDEDNTERSARSSRHELREQDEQRDPDHAEVSSSKPKLRGGGAPKNMMSVQREERQDGAQLPPPAQNQKMNQQTSRGQGLPEKEKNSEPTTAAADHDDPGDKDRGSARPVDTARLQEYVIELD